MPKEKQTKVATTKKTTANQEEGCCRKKGTACSWPARRNFAIGNDLPPKRDVTMPKAKQPKAVDDDEKDAEEKVAEKKEHSLFVARPRNFAIGNDLPPKRDVTRFVRWPQYIIRQRRSGRARAASKVPPFAEPVPEDAGQADEGGAVQAAGEV
eukprot:Sspe_Gene.556::Locus_186_Transcript_11_19_Confidence_0.094_Length_713::g.556::m.556